MENKNFNPKMKISIIGAGISGLFAAWKLVEAGHDVTILEKTKKVGGMASSFQYEDMTLDYGPHKLYSQLPGVMGSLKDILGDQCLNRKKSNSLNLEGNYFKFPLQIGQLIKKIPFLGVKCGVGYGQSVAKSLIKKKNLESYEDFLLTKFGKPMYELLFKDYAKKVWGDPKLLTEELARKRIPVGSLLDVVKNILLPSKDVSAEFFYYPKKGIGQLSDIIYSKIVENGGKISFETKPESITVNEGKVKIKSNNGEFVSDLVISTIPVKDLPALFEPLAPVEVLTAGKSLKMRSLIVLYVIANKDKILEKDNWIFFPQKDYIFNRISEQGSFSPYVIPKGKAVLMVEITCDADDHLWKSSDDEIFELAITDLEKGKIIKKDEVVKYFTRRAHKVYPVYSLNYKKNLNLILDYLDSFGNVYSVGRQGLFNYNNIDHCLDMSFTAVNQILNQTQGWKKTREKFDTYKIVD